MRTISCATALALFGLLPAQAFAQADDSGADTLNPVASMRCSALGELDDAGRVTALYYLAGYADGERDAMTFATVGTSTEAASGSAAAQPAAPPAEAQPAPDASGGQSQGQAAAPPASRRPAVLPMLSEQEILAACAQSPDSRIVDIITAHGGAETR